MDEHANVPTRPARTRDGRSPLQLYLEAAPLARASVGAACRAFPRAYGQVRGFRRSKTTARVARRLGLDVGAAHTTPNRVVLMAPYRLKHAVTWPQLRVEVKLMNGDANATGCFLLPTTLSNCILRLDIGYVRMPLDGAQ